MSDFILPSFFLAGFECATQKLRSGVRVDIARTSGHTDFAIDDYCLMRRCGMSGVRDGFRWPMIESRPRRYDWSSARALIRAADEAKTEVVWDLCHYGVPNGLE